MAYGDSDLDPADRPELTLLLTAQTRHILDGIAELARGSGLNVERRGSLLLVTLTDVSEFVALVDRELSSGETDRTRAVVVEPGIDASEALAAALRAVPMSTMAARFRSAELIDLRADDSFYSRYQPIIDLRTLEVRGYEALIRADQGDGELGAGQLIEAARAGDWLHELDQIGRESGIRGAGSWLDPGELLFLNVLPSSLDLPKDVLRETLKAAERSGIPVTNLVFELVETDRIDDIAHTVEVLKRYQDLGAGIAVDDVASGYATLSIVAELRPDVVKLDGTLTEKLPDTTTEAVIRAVVTLAHDIDAHVIAEWVQTPEQVAVLTELGVDWCQGRFFGSPWIRT
ncbi:MAG: EAL domain-containing protein [Actinomycetia bacterium]|nr:EAL domain-containing protein [Actinomycetes bacterium]MCP3913603.1 EAL domain-containing protein [Actinomycetes bacterium]MCP4085240.1 EAL domain-containing protein [Actinomycetes bacterium]